MRATAQSFDGWSPSATLAALLASIAADVHNELTRELLGDLMEEIAHRAPRDRPYRVYLVGGGTALLFGWRDSTIDADLHADDEEVFRDIQDIKERLEVNVELVRPEDFVPALSETASRHVPIRTILRVSFFHYDPYSQALSKVVRGFRKDLQDARAFVVHGMVDPKRLRSLVQEIEESAYARYPAISSKAVLEAVDDFLREIET